MSKYIITEYQSDMTAASRINFDCESYTFRILSFKSIDGQIIVELCGQGLSESHFIKMLSRLQKFDDVGNSGLAALCDNLNFNRHISQYGTSGYKQEVFDTASDVRYTYPYKYHKRTILSPTDIETTSSNSILRGSKFIYQLYFGEKSFPIHYDAPESETICL